MCESGLAVVKFGNESVHWMAHQIDKCQIQRFWKVKVVEMARVDKCFVWIFSLKIGKLLYQSLFLVLIDNFRVIFFVVKPLGKSVVRLSKRVKK